MPHCWLEVSIRKVLRPVTSTQVFLGFPVSISECWDGSQDSACFSCSPPELNFLDPYFIFMYMHYNHCQRATAHLQLNILLIFKYYVIQVSSFLQVWYSFLYAKQNCSSICYVVKYTGFRRQRWWLHSWRLPQFMKTRLVKTGYYGYILYIYI